MGYPLRMPPALVPYLANDLHMRRTGTPLIRYAEIGKKAWLCAKLQPGRARKRINAT